MGRFVKGDIVVLNFPFTNLLGAKRRPALVVADLVGDDVILCQITSRSRPDRYSVEISENDCKEGKLSVESIIRPNKLFTADESIILYKACKITDEKVNDVLAAIANIMNA